MRVLITGIGGFIGSHFLEYYLNNTSWEIIGIDSFYHKGQISRIESAKSRIDLIKTNFLNRVKIYNHDLSTPIDNQLENQIMERKIINGVVVENKINYIINLASDSAVERSVHNPSHCWRNNCNLIINMMEFARKINPDKFIQIGTDEEYGEYYGNEKGHIEWDSVVPSNVYAASKAAQTALATAYWRSYNLPIAITNTMNIIGEWQDPEKFLPKIISYVAQEKEVPIYGESESSIGSRVYLDARNKADAIKFILEQPIVSYNGGKERKPNRYNICGDTELNNLELAQRVAKLMNKKLKYKLISSESARPGYDRRYALNGDKLKNLGWKMPYSFDESLKRIIDWTLKNPHWLI